MSDHSSLPRETVIDALALALELIGQGKYERTHYLLDQLLDRLLIDNAVDEKADMVEKYGSGGVMRQ